MWFPVLTGLESETDARPQASSLLTSTHSYTSVSECNILLIESGGRIQIIAVLESPLGAGVLCASGKMPF